MSSKKWLVIGISGATCSGKSTLSKEIHKMIKDSVLVQQDDYFLPPNDPRHEIIPELNHVNWEIITGIDMKKMYTDILKIMESTSHETNSENPNTKRVLILDGFLLFETEYILSLCDLKYFITLTKEECWERRNSRVYDPPDCPGYFEKVVWPEYVRYESNMKQAEHLRNSLTFIDGLKNKEEIFEVVFTEIKQLLS